MRLIPIQVPRHLINATLHQSHWHNETSFFGAGLRHYNGQALISYRSAKSRPNLCFPLTLTLLKERANGDDYEVQYSDNNDVVPAFERAGTLLGKDSHAYQDVSRFLSNSSRIRNRDDKRETFLHTLVLALAQFAQDHGADIFSGPEDLHFGPNHACLDYILPYSDSLENTLGESRLAFMTETLGDIKTDRFLPITDIGLFPMSGHDQLAQDRWDMVELTAKRANQAYPKLTPISTLF